MLISTAYAQAAGSQAEAGGAQWIQLLFLAGIFALFYFLLIRPQRKRQKEHETMVRSLKSGDEVIAGGGLLGKITAIDEQYLSLRIATGVDVKMQRVSVLSVLPKGTLKSSGGEGSKET